jgi:hypothetical protein
VSRAPARNALTLALAVFWFTPALHADASRLAWDPAWSRFRAIEYGVTGAAAAGTFALYFAVPDADEPRWVGAVLWDDTVRRGLRLRSPEARDAARTASDVTVLSSVIWAVGVDSVVVPLARHSSDVAAHSRPWTPSRLHSAH